MRLRNSDSSERRTFQYPLQPCPRVAVVCDTLQIPSGCRHVPESQSAALRSSDLETAAAPASWFLGPEATAAGWRPAFPLVVFTGARHGFLDSTARDEMWRRFGVPVFEQLLSSDGRLVASECEAHDGLHLNPVVRHGFDQGELLLDGGPTGIAAREMPGLCGCGAAGPRITDTRPSA